MTLLVDSHCHLDFPEFSEKLGGVLERAKANGIGYLLCVCVDLQGYEEILQLAKRYGFIFASVGVHPNTDYIEENEPSVDQLLELAFDPNVIAIGETGLDYFRSGGNLDWQRDRFRTHIRAACRAQKPLIIHSRAARKDTIAILRDENAADAGGVMHCFSEDWDMARSALDLGFYISFSGIVTFRNAGELREIAKKVPDDRILVETDSPYLAPVPVRGRTNEPAFVRYTANVVAELRGQEGEVFADQTTENFFRLFDSATRGREGGILTQTEASVWYCRTALWYR